MRSLYLDEVMADAPVALWEMQDDSGNPVDSSGNGYDMTSVTNTPDYAQIGPMEDRSIRCVGGETILRSSHVSVVQSNFTVELILDLQAVTVNNMTLFHNGNPGSNGWGISVNANGTVKYLCGGVAFGTASFQVYEGLGRFTHLVMKKESGAGGAFSYWKDGVLDRTVGTTNPNVPNGTVTLGGASIQTAYSYVAVYETALSSARIAEHYAAWKSILRRQMI